MIPALPTTEFDRAISEARQEVWRLKVASRAAQAYATRMRVLVRPEKIAAMRARSEAADRAAQVAAAAMAKASRRAEALAAARNEHRRAP